MPVWRIILLLGFVISAAPARADGPSVSTGDDGAMVSEVCFKAGPHGATACDPPPTTGAAPDRSQPVKLGVIPDPDLEPEGSLNATGL